MEWNVCVNDILLEDITKLDYTLIPPGFRGDVRNVRIMQSFLTKIIDTLGEQSASAQGLNKVITTADKLRNSSTYFLYLLKDTDAKDGKGDVIGLLKVGPKRLYLTDQHNQLRVVEPMCVLDFFVVPERQRHGYGKVLFDHMIKDIATPPWRLAIDGPSAKMQQFLARNYGLKPLIRQSNNFAVTPQFFQQFENDRSISNRSSAMNKPRESTNSVPLVGRFAALRPQSSISSVIHGGGD